MQRPRRMKGRGNRRRGAAMVEAAIILSVFLTLVLGMIDLGLAVFRQQRVSEVARQLVRKAIVQGQFAPTSLNGGPWGPTTYTGTGSSTDAISTSVQPYMGGLDPSQVNLKVVWTNGNNNVESTVQVTVTTTWTPIFSYIFGGSTRTLSAESTMPIAH
jgi:Flp pilus assembly protein TadG